MWDHAPEVPSHTLPSVGQTQLLQFISAQHSPKGQILSAAESRHLAVSCFITLAEVLILTAIIHLYAVLSVTNWWLFNKKILME